MWFNGLLWGPTTHNLLPSPSSWERALHIFTIILQGFCWRVKVNDDKRDQIKLRATRLHLVGEEFYGITEGSQDTVGCWVGKMSQLVKCLTWVWSLHICKKSSVLVCAYFPCTGEVRNRQIPGAHWPTSILHSVSYVVPKIRWTALEEWHPRLTSLYAHMRYLSQSCHLLIWNDSGQRSVSGLVFVTFATNQWEKRN